MRIQRLTLDEWVDVFPASGFEWAHRPDVLRVIDAHATGELQLYGGFKGEQPVGLLPAVVRTELFVTAVLSPPPGLGIPRLGPILLPTSPKRSKQEKVNREFTTGILDAIDAHEPLTLVGFACPAVYADPRPYIWAGFDVEPRFTYRLDLDGRTPEDVKKSFSSSVRREMRDAEAAGITVSLRGMDGTREVYTAHANRRNEQGDDYPVSWEYTRDLVAALGEHARTYVAETPEGEFAGGLTVLYSNDEGYYIQGGTRAGISDVSPNALLHWHAIEDILTDPALSSVTRYDLGNATIESLSRYKSKYGGEVVSQYLVTSGRLMTLARRAYELITY